MKKTVFIVGKLETQIDIIIGGVGSMTKPLIWVDGMIGAFPAFDTIEKAHDYAEKGDYLILRSTLVEEVLPKKEKEESNDKKRKTRNTPKSDVKRITRKSVPNGRQNVAGNRR